MNPDLEIAQKATLRPIGQIAEKLGIDPAVIEPYGHYKAKLPLSLISKNPAGRLILVTALTPTPAGEGKTTVSIGLSEGMNQLGHKTAVVLREPSLGPVFGIKGGAAGGGHAQVIPMEDINLHFTGDFSAIEKANNLLAALIDNELQKRDSALRLDPRNILWKRVMDMNDRALRQMVIGLGGPSNGMPRETGFNITPASEIMAILCLAEDFSDLKERLGNILVGFNLDREPVYARDLAAVGAMAILLKDAIKPNLVQTLEGNPAILHGGPFANIAQGTNSVIATKMGLSLADFVVTEAGFSTELGAEKFFNIKCASSGLRPEAAVVVATVRALRYHGGGAINEASADKVEAGLANLQKHVENIGKHGVSAVVAINKFSDDTPEEITVIQNACANWGVRVAVSDGWAKGGAGMHDLARAVVDTVQSGTSQFKPLYQPEDSVSSKINTIARELYGAVGVQYTAEAAMNLRRIERIGLGGLRICMAKTQSSLSDDPEKIGRPEGFDITVRSFEIASGAGFLVPIAGNIMRMPGLPAKPASMGMDIDDKGVITGLS